MKSIAEIPLRYRSIFSKYKTFNEIQSNVFNDVFYTNKSVIVSAPTGSGKTVIFELAIINLLQLTNPDLTDFVKSYDYKVVYVAPTKALCGERYVDWCKKFNQFGLQCLEVTGDSEINDFADLSSANIIITTPEKWDSLTRKWKDNEDIVRTVKLFMIDEVHLLNEDVRGPILEAVVSRMKTIQFNIKSYENFEMNLRFIAASATIPNIEDLAEWIGKKDPEKISYFQFSEEKRPVKLQKHVMGFDTTLSSFKFDMSLNYKLSQIIRKFSGGRPTLIFCSSRKSVEMASTVLQKESFIFPLSDNHKAALCDLVKKTKDTKLRPLLCKGIAYHHAGLTYEDRYIIEDAFRNGLLLVLVSTNTLSMGVNLPAHLVIVKSTEFFVNGQAIQYSESAILQMIGRAGRPQYDLNGVAVIMTQQKNVSRYENLMNGCTPVESHLHKHLAEHLNSEIVLQTVTDLDIAMEWIRSTFLYIRACKSPKNYGFKAPGMTKDKIEKKLEEMCLIQINCLETNGLITKEQTFGLSIKATSYGKLMARYYISFDTIKLFRQIRGNESFLETFNFIVRSKEFSDFTLRVNDKKLLNELNNYPIRFPIKGKIKTIENKVSCLIQANFGNIHINDPSMIQDSLKMIRIGERVSKCFYQYIRLSENRLMNTNGIYKILLHSIIIMKCFKAKLWENSEYVSKQLNKIGAVYSKALVDAGKTSFKAILDTSTQSLEMILNKPPPFGTEIHDTISVFPDFQIEINFERNTRTLMVLILQNNKHFLYDGSTCYLIIGDSDNNLIIFNDKILNLIKEDYQFRRNITVPNINVEWITAHLIHESLVGIDKSLKVPLNVVEEIEGNKLKKNEKPSKRKIQTKLNPSKKKRLESEENLLETVQNNCKNELLEDEDIFIDLSTQMPAKSKFIESNATLSPDLFIEDSPETVKRPYTKETQSKFTNLVHEFEYHKKPKISRKEISTLIGRKNKCENIIEKTSTDSGIMENTNDLSKMFEEEFYQIKENDQNLNACNEWSLCLEMDELPFDEYTNLSNDIIWSKVEEIMEPSDVANLETFDKSGKLIESAELMQLENATKTSEIYNDDLKLIHLKQNDQKQQKYLKNSKENCVQLLSNVKDSESNKQSLQQILFSKKFQIEQSYSKHNLDAFSIPIDFSNKNYLKSPHQCDYIGIKELESHCKPSFSKALDLSTKLFDKINEMSNIVNCESNPAEAEDLSIKKLIQPQYQSFGSSFLQEETNSNRSNLAMKINAKSQQQKIQYPEPSCLIKNDACDLDVGRSIFKPSQFIEDNSFVQKKSLLDQRQGSLGNKICVSTDIYTNLDKTGQKQEILSASKNLFKIPLASDTNQRNNYEANTSISQKFNNGFMKSSYKEFSSNFLPLSTLQLKQNFRENNDIQDLNHENLKSKIRHYNTLAINRTNQNSSALKDCNSKYWHFYQNNFGDSFSNNEHYFGDIQNEYLSSNRYHPKIISEKMQLPKKSVKRLGLSKPKLAATSYNIAKPRNIFGPKNIETVNATREFMSANNLLKIQNPDAKMITNINLKNFCLPKRQEKFHLKTKLENDFVPKKNILEYNGSNSFHSNNTSKDLNIYEDVFYEHNSPNENQYALERTPKEQIVLWTELKNDSAKKKLRSSIHISDNNDGQIEINSKNNPKYNEKIANDICKIKEKVEGFLGVADTSSVEIERIKLYEDHILTPGKLLEKTNERQEAIDLNLSTSCHDNVYLFNKNKISMENDILQNSYAHYIEKFVHDVSNIELLKTLTEGELQIDILTLIEISDIKMPFQLKQFEDDNSEALELFLNDDVPNISDDSLDSEQKQSSTYLIREQYVINGSNHINLNQNFINNDKVSKEINIFQEYFPNYENEKRSFPNDEQFNSNSRKFRRPNPYRLQIYPKSSCFPIRRPISNNSTEEYIFNKNKFSTIGQRNLVINKLAERLNYDPNYNEEAYKKDYMSCIIADEIPNNITEYFGNDILQQGNSQDGKNFFNYFGNLDMDQNNQNPEKFKNNYILHGNHNLINVSKNFSNLEEFSFPKVEIGSQPTENSSNFENKNLYNSVPNPMNIDKNEYVPPKIEMDFDSEEQQIFDDSPNIFEKNEFGVEGKFDLELNSEESDIFINSIEPNNFANMQFNENEILKNKIAHDLNSSIQFSQNILF